MLAGSSSKVFVGSDGQPTSLNQILFCVMLIPGQRRGSNSVNNVHHFAERG